jgi:hypothetical protein
MPERVRKFTFEGVIPVKDPSTYDFACYLFRGTTNDLDYARSFYSRMPMHVRAAVDELNQAMRECAVWWDTTPAYKRFVVAWNTFE